MAQTSLSCKRARAWEHTQAWLVTLSTVRVGDVTLNEVEGIVHQHDMPIALLGMSFLNRMEMKRDGQTMTLRKRY